MKFYHFGDTEKPAIMLIPGNGCHYKANFGLFIPYLELAYHVIRVSFDGFDENEDTVFTSVTDETEKIEKYITDNFGGHIHAIYASAEGGNYVALLAQRGNITFDDAVLGNPNLDQNSGLMAKMSAKKAAAKIYSNLQKNQQPAWVQNGCDVDMTFVKEESVFNQVYTGQTTMLEKKILPKEGKIHVLFTTHMGGTYQQRYNKHFADMDMVAFEYPQEEMLFKYPKHLSLIVRRMTNNLK